MRRRFSVSVLLLFLRPGLIAAEAGRKVVFGVVGSSFLLDPEYGADLSNSDIVWVFAASNRSPVTILDYIPNYHKGEPNEDFKSRLHFNASDGSLMLNNLKPSDQGIYTITVNAEWIKSQDFNLIEPLSEPLINSTCMETTIELTCRVSVGKASSILWTKDDEVITNGQRYQLVQNNSKLIISKVKISICGKYTCTVENPVSKKNNSYSLSIYGLALAHQFTVAFSVAALIVAVVALIAIVAANLFDEMPSLTERIKITSLVRNMLQFFQFTPILSFIILFGAYICWLSAEGLSGIIVFMWVLCCLHLTLTVLLACNMMACDWKTLNKILKTKLCRLMLRAANPLGAIIEICASSVLLVEVKKQADS